MASGKETAASDGSQVRVIEKANAKRNIAVPERTLLRHDGLSQDDKRLTDGTRYSSKDATTDRIQLITQIMSSDEKEIQKFMDLAIEAGCEGIMLKHRESVYRAGSREY
ncbi:MAG: hypothetical protein ACRD8Z_00675, partial [Nitrososphaeraceae archaeon]